MILWCGIMSAGCMCMPVWPAIPTSDMPAIGGNTDPTMPPAPAPRAPMAAGVSGWPWPGVRLPLAPATACTAAAAPLVAPAEVAAGEPAGCADPSAAFAGSAAGSMTVCSAPAALSADVSAWMRASMLLIFSASLASRTLRRSR